MSIQKLRSLIVANGNPPSIEHAARTAIAAVLSLLIARLCTLPEAYWAAISTMIVMQSTLGAALPISVQRLAGTAIGALAGALVGSHFPENSLAFGIAAFVIGVICVVVKIERAIVARPIDTLELLWPL